jgi:hypothetical protein
MSISELASRLGIHPARLDRHLDHLQSVSALSCKTTNCGKLILSFPDTLTNAQGNAVDPEKLKGSGWSNPKVAENLLPNPYFPDQIMGYLNFQDDQIGSENSAETEKHHILLVEEVDLLANC